MERASKVDGFASRSHLSTQSQTQICNCLNFISSSHALPTNVESEPVVGEGMLHLLVTVSLMDLFVCRDRCTM